MFAAVPYAVSAAEMRFAGRGRTRCARMTDNGPVRNEAWLLADQPWQRWASTLFVTHVVVVGPLRRRGRSSAAQFMTPSAADPHCSMRRSTRAAGPLSVG